MAKGTGRTKNAFPDAALLVSHRCLPHVRALRFASRRKTYRRRLVETVNGEKATGLDYLVAPTGLYALFTPADPRRTSALMRTLQSGSVHDFRPSGLAPGHVWRDRHAVTLVQNGPALLGIMLAIDLHLVAEGRIQHPAQWKQGGWSELVGIRKRYRAVRPEAVSEALGMGMDAETFAQWYIDRTEQCLRRNAQGRIGELADTLAVGHIDWVDKLAESIPRSFRTITELNQGQLPVPEEGMAALVVRKRLRRYYIDRFIRHARSPGYAPS